MGAMQDIGRSLGAGCALFARDERSVALFDGRRPRAIRSFAAYLLLLPAFFAIAAGLYDCFESLVQPRMPAFSREHFVVLVACALSLAWAAHGVMVDLLTDSAGSRGRLRAYVSAFNWSSVPGITFIALPFMAHQMGLIPPALTVAAAGASLFVVAASRAFLAERMLKLGTPAALVVAGFDVALNVVFVEIAVLATLT